MSARLKKPKVYTFDSPIIGEPIPPGSIFSDERPFADNESTAREIALVAELASRLKKARRSLRKRGI